MRHRHLEYDAGTPVEQLGPAALDDLLDRGDLDDWAPLARAVQRDPCGELAERLLRVVDAHPMYGTSRLWRTWIQRLRDSQPPTNGATTLPELRRRAGLTQRQLADRMGVSQPDLSRLERRRDVKLSTLRTYVAAVGAQLRLVVAGPSGDEELVVDDHDPSSAR